MTRRWIVLAMAVALAAAGCIGSDADDEALDADSEDVDSQDAAGDGSSGTGDGDAAVDAGPPPINRTHEDAGLVGVPLYDPGQMLGAKITFARQSYANGANGTWVLGYEVQPREDHQEMTVATSAEAVAEGVPDYDLFVYGPDDEVVASSYNSGADEEAEVDDVSADTYLVLAYFHAGAADTLTTEIVVR